MGIGSSIGESFGFSLGNEISNRLKPDVQEFNINVHKGIQEIENFRKSFDKDVDKFLEKIELVFNNLNTKSDSLMLDIDDRVKSYSIYTSLFIQIILVIFMISICWRLNFKLNETSDLFINFLKQMYLFSLISVIILLCINLVIWRLVESFIISIKMTIIFYCYFGFVIIFNSIDKYWRKDRPNITKKYKFFLVFFTILVLLGSMFLLCEFLNKKIDFRSNVNFSKNKTKECSDNRFNLIYGKCIFVSQYSHYNTPNLAISLCVELDSKSPMIRNDSELEFLNKLVDHVTVKSYITQTKTNDSFEIFLYGRSYNMIQNDIKYYKWFDGSMIEKKYWCQKHPLKNKFNIYFDTKERCIKSTDSKGLESHANICIKDV